MIKFSHLHKSHSLRHSGNTLVCTLHCSAVLEASVVSFEVQLARSCLFRRVFDTVESCKQSSASVNDYVESTGDVSVLFHLIYSSLGTSVSFVIKYSIYLSAMYRLQAVVLPL